MHRRLFVLLLVLLPGALHAEILPEFRLEFAAWHATDVVVATEDDEIDGRLIVLESWRGDLRRGADVEVPGLAAFRTAESRTTSAPFPHEDSVNRPEIVSGNRMVLFLRRSGTTWEGAIGGDAQISTVWIENDQPFGFTQVTSRGDGALVNVGGDDERAFRARFREVDGIRAAFDEARDVSDPGARADRIAELVSPNSWFALEDSFEALADCGADALPALRKLLANNSKRPLHDRIIDAMVKTGDDSVAGDLATVIREELAYWSASAPRLPLGWWNEVEESETSERRERYGRLFHALLALRKVPSPAAHEDVARVCELWTSRPALADIRQMADACKLVDGRRAAQR